MLIECVTAPSLINDTEAILLASGVSIEIDAPSAAETFRDLAVARHWSRSGYEEGIFAAGADNVK